jgi:hypothetical protein
MREQIARSCRSPIGPSIADHRSRSSFLARGRCGGGTPHRLSRLRQEAPPAITGTGRTRLSTLRDDRGGSCRGTAPPVLGAQSTRTSSVAPALRAGRPRPAPPASGQCATRSHLRGPPTLRIVVGLRAQHGARHRAAGLRWYEALAHASVRAHVRKRPQRDSRDRASRRRVPSDTGPAVIGDGGPGA